MVDDAAVAPCRHARRERCDEKERCADVAGEHGVERVDVEVGGGAEQKEAGVVAQYVNVAGVLDHLAEFGGIAEIGCHEACPAARSGDCCFL